MWTLMLLGRRVCKTGEFERTDQVFAGDFLQGAIAVTEDDRRRQRLQGGHDLVRFAFLNGLKHGSDGHNEDERDSQRQCLDVFALSDAKDDEAENGAEPEHQLKAADHVEQQLDEPARTKPRHTSRVWSREKWKAGGFTSAWSWEE